MAQDSELDKIKEGYIELFHRSDKKTGKHLIEQIYKIHDNLIEQAQKANDPNEAFGLLKQASGIIMIVHHIKTYTGKPLGRE